MKEVKQYAEEKAWQQHIAQWLGIHIVHLQRGITNALEKRIQKLNKMQRKALFLLFVLTAFLYLTLLFIRSLWGSTVPMSYAVPQGISHEHVYDPEARRIRSSSSTTLINNPKE